MKHASDKTKDYTQLTSLGSAISPSQLDQNPYKLEVGSTIQYGNPPEYGVIKWIGILPGRENIEYAGVEMVNYSTHNWTTVLIIIVHFSVYFGVTNLLLLFC